MLEGHLLTFVKEIVDLYMHQTESQSVLLVKKRSCTQIW